jgi:hypothetical protein
MDLGKFHHDPTSFSPALVHHGLFEGNHPLLWPFFSGERHIVIYINLPRSIYKWIIFMDIWNILIINGLYYPLYYPLFPWDSDG